jgi:hypothetical protein
MSYSQRADRMCACVRWLMRVVGLISGCKRRPESGILKCKSFVIITRSGTVVLCIQGHPSLLSPGVDNLAPAWAGGWRSEPQIHNAVVDIRFLVDEVEFLKRMFNVNKPFNWWHATHFVKCLIIWNTRASRHFYRTCLPMRLKLTAEIEMYVIFILHRAVL